MAPLRLLCLHGLGSSANIFESQLGPLISELSKDNSATFTFLDGIFPQPPGLGIAGLYDPPYFGHFRGDVLQQATSLSSLINALQDSDYVSSVQEAYQLLYDMIKEEGPFDGILGFSHGATLAMMFLLQHAEKNPIEPPWSLCGCAIFIAGPSPFSDNGRRLEADEGGKMLRIPTVHIMGNEDVLYADALKLYGLCDKDGATLLVHEKGHVIPRDRATVGRIAKAIKDLRGKMVVI